MADTVHKAITAGSVSAGGGALEGTRRPTPKDGYLKRVQNTFNYNLPGNKDGKSD